jgi:hypothetical protein
MTPSEFKAAMPAFLDEDDSTIQRWITRSTPYFNVDAWDDLYSDGLLYWVAHSIVLEGALGATLATAGGGQDAVGKAVGKVSVRYSDRIVELKANDPYMRTTYGQEYRRLAKLVGSVLITSA